MGLRENIEILLQEQNPDKGKICSSCGHRDGHNLQYCYKCPGTYVPYKETWEDSLRCFATNKNYFNNRVECFGWAYKKFFIWTKLGHSKEARELENNFDHPQQQEEFRRILYETFGLIYR